MSLETTALISSSAPFLSLQEELLPDKSEASRSLPSTLCWKALQLSPRSASLGSIVLQRSDSSFGASFWAPHNHDKVFFDAWTCQTFCLSVSFSIHSFITVRRTGNLGPHGQVVLKRLQGFWDAWGGFEISLPSCRLWIVVDITSFLCFPFSPFLSWEMTWLTIFSTYCWHSSSMGCLEISQEPQHHSSDSEILEKSKALKSTLRNLTLQWTK